MRRVGLRTAQGRRSGPHGAGGDRAGGGRRRGTLDIAAVFPTLGRYAVSGQQSLRGARLAVEELNRAGGVHGRRLRLAEYRTGSYVVDARHAAALAASDGVLAIVGANSSELSRAIAEVAESVGVPQLTNVSTASDITWDPQTGPTGRSCSGCAPPTT